MANPGRVSLIMPVASAIVVAASLALLTTGRPELALAPGLMLIFFLVVGRNLEWGYLAIVFLMPFAAYRALGGLEYLRLHWMLAFCITAILFFRFLIDKQQRLGLRSALWPWLSVYLAASVVSALYSDHPHTAWKNVVLQAVAYLFIALGMILISRRGLVSWLPKVIITSISIGSAFAAVGFFLDIPWFAEKVGGDGFKRGLGVTTDPNSLSLMILFVMPFLAHLLGTTKRKRVRFLALGLMGVNLLGLVTTYSRGGVLLLGLMTVAILASHSRLLSPKNIGLVLAVVGLAAAVAVMVIPPSYWQRQLSLVQTENQDLSLRRRASYLIVGWEAFQRRPIQGSGPGVFKEIYAHHPIADEMVREGRNRERPAHNTYLEVLVGGGLISLAAFVGALLTGLVNLTRAKRRFLALGDEPMARVCATYRLSYVSLLLFLFLFSDLFQKYLLLCLAVSQAALRLAEDERLALTEADTDGSETALGAAS